MQIILLSHIEYIFVFFLFLIWKTKCLNSLKVMKKSLIPKYSDPTLLLILKIDVGHIKFQPKPTL